MPTIQRVTLLLCLAAAAACGDDDNLADPTAQNFVDTVTVHSLTGTPISTPSGFNINDGPIRTDLRSDFEFAYNVQPDGQRVFLPRAALGLPSTTTADPGLQARSETFAQIVVAASNGYVTDEPIVLDVGQRYVVRSRVVCGGLGVPLYGKLEILSFDATSVTFQVLANSNCGYKGLEPGFPTR